MKLKTLSAFLTALLLALPAAATEKNDTLMEKNDTLLDLRDANRVILIEDSAQVSLHIQGRGNDRDYSYDYTSTSDNGSSSVVHSKGTGWDFGSITLGRKGNARWHTEFRQGGLGFGFVNALGAPAEMEVDMASSYEIFADLASFHRCSADDSHDFSLGFGLDWRNLRMTGDRRFVKEGAVVSIVPYPDGAEPNFSRIKIFSLTFPFRYQFNFGAKKKWYVHAAAILKVNTYASLKTRYTLDGRKYKEVSKNIRQKPVSVDLMAAFGWNFLGVYIKYDPCKALNTTFCPEFNTLAAGLTFFY